MYICNIAQHSRQPLRIINTKKLCGLLALQYIWNEIKITCMQHFYNFSDAELKSAIIEALNGHDTRRIEHPFVHLIRYDDGRSDLSIHYLSCRKKRHRYYTVYFNSNGHVCRVRDFGRVDYDYGIYGITHYIDDILTDCGFVFSNEWISTPSDC